MGHFWIFCGLVAIGLGIENGLTAIGKGLTTCVVAPATGKEE